MVGLLVVLGVIALTFVFAFVGQRVGARMEEPNLAAGEIEQNMKRKISPSVLGGLIGIIPFAVFIILLVVEAMTNDFTPAGPAHGSSSSSESSSGE